MHLQLAIVFFLSLLRLCCCLWPLPEKYEHGSSICWLSPDVHMTFQPIQPTFWYQLPQAFQRTLHNAHVGEEEGRDLVESAFSRLQEAVRAHTFVPWKFYPKGAKFEPALSTQNSFIRSIKVKQQRELLTSGAQEAYKLTISKNCDVLIQANNPLGVIRAFTSFTQLFYRHSHNESDHVYMKNAPITISDSPAFEHRGLNLDIARSIISPRDVMKTIDALAFCKFNRLHLHASDAQSWPLEIPSLPELAAKGAYHESQIWSVSDLKKVQQFGAQRGVEVYLEIDMPGHTASIHQAYPELITSFNRKPWREFSAQPPSGQLDLNSTSAAVDTFIKTLLSDLLPRTKPFSSLFHLGGDEITAAAYNLTPSQLKPYLQSFLGHAISIVRGQPHGLTPLVWEEQVLDYNLTLPADTIVQTWRGKASASSPRSSLAEVVSRGHRALFGSNEYWYLDCGHGTWLDPASSYSSSGTGSSSKNSSTSSSTAAVQNDNDNDPYQDYCTPYKSFRHILSYDPLADIPPSHHHLVLGGEVHLWGELTDSVNLDAKLWPRAAAAAEVLWAGKGVVGEESTRRLAEMREWILGMGVGSGPVQVGWCLMNEGSCVG